MPTKSRARKRTFPPSYWKLARIHPLRSIGSEQELIEASEMVDDVLRLGKLDAGQQAYLDTLSDLIQLYESQHEPFDRLPRPGLLKFLMEQHGMSQSQLARDTDIPQSTVSQILSGKRPFSRDVIYKLAARFHVGPELFLEHKENVESK